MVVLYGLSLLYEILICSLMEVAEPVSLKHISECLMSSTWHRDGLIKF